MNDFYLVSTRLKTAMENSRMTASELARRSGINKSNISRYLKGEIIPKAKAINAMATALQVTPTWLFGLSSSNCLDLSRLTTENQAKLSEYYQSLLYAQRHPDSTFTYEEIPK